MRNFMIFFLNFQTYIFVLVISIFMHVFEYLANFFFQGKQKLKFENYIFKEKKK